MAAGGELRVPRRADLQIDSEFAQLEDMPAIVIEEPPRLRCLVGAANPRRCKMKSNWRPPVKRIQTRRRFDVQRARMGKVVDAANAQSLVEEISDSAG